MAPSNFPSGSSEDGLGKSIMRIFFGAALGIGISYCATFGFNKLLNDREYIGESYYSISRADGLFSYTELSRSNLYDEVTKTDFFDGKTITDNNRDGIVDKLKIRKIGLTREVTREKDYEQYKKEFDEADKILANTKKRFKVE